MAILSQAVSAWKKFAIALYGGVSQLLAGLILVTVAPDTGISDITTNQWLVIGLSVLGAGGAAYGLSNRST